VTLAVLLAITPGAEGGIFGPSNYWECVLARMQRARDSSAAGRVIARCRQDFFPIAVPPKVEPGMFGPKNRRECLLKYTKGVSSRLGLNSVTSACFFSALCALKGTGRGPTRRP
jgi:hypothetical protein